MNYKYYIIQSSNGNISIVSEWNDLNSAIMAYHAQARTLWGAEDVIEGWVEIVYSMWLDVVGGYKEHIEHPQTEENTEVAGE